MQCPPPRPRPSSAPTMVITSTPAFRSSALVWVLRSYATTTPGSMATRLFPLRDAERERHPKRHRRPAGSRPGPRHPHLAPRPRRQLAEHPDVRSRHDPVRHELRLGARSVQLVSREAHPRRQHHHHDHRPHTYEALVRVEHRTRGARVLLRAPRGPRHRPLRWLQRTRHRPLRWLQRTRPRAQQRHRRPPLVLRRVTGMPPGQSGVATTTEKSSHAPGTPLSVCVPRVSKR